jgi:hypothetical protein
LLDRGRRVALEVDARDFLMQTSGMNFHVFMSFCGLVFGGCLAC